MSNDTFPKMTPEENVKPTCSVVWSEYRPGCWTYFCVIAFALIVLVWFNIFRSGPPLRIAKDTTYITEPLTPDGRYVDYFADFERRYYPPETATDDNGYRMVIRVIGGPLETSAPEYMQGFYEKLGLDYIRDKPTMTYITPEDFFKNRYILHPEEFEDIIAMEKSKLLVGEEEGEEETEEETGMLPSSTIVSFDPSKYWQSLSNSQELHKNIIVQKWLEANNAALDLVVEASKKPFFVVPVVVPGDATNMYNILLPGLQGVRSFVRGLQTRATIRVSEGNIDGAIEDILACYRLGRHLGRPSFIVQQLVGVACEGIAHSVAYNGNLTTKANTEQLEHLRDGLNNLPPRATWQDGVEMERLALLDMLTAIMKDPSSMFTGFPYSRGDKAPVDYILPLIGLDWNVIFERVNRAYDEMIAGTLDPTRYTPDFVRLLTLEARSRLAADILISMLLPATGAFQEAIRRIDCTMNMKRIVLAMHLYEREYGTLPPALTLDANGKPLHGWRTLLLPYFGDEELADLYAQIRLDEPWDSGHNRQFHTRNLDIYRCPSNPSMPDGHTSYSVIVGDELLFTNGGEGQKFGEHGPNILMLAERKNDTVCWMQPDAEILQTDAELGISHSSPTSIGSNHTGGANFGLLDGGVTFISETIDNATFVELVRGTAKKRP